MSITNRDVDRERERESMGNVKVDRAGIVGTHLTATTLRVKAQPYNHASHKQVDSMKKLVKKPLRDSRM